jgi:chromate transporter
MTSKISKTKLGPASVWHLFWSFTLLGLQGFGGVLTIVQRELVEKKQWFTPEEFVEDWSVAQVLPGPNVINLGLMFGSRHFGLPGAIAATTGLMLIPSLGVLCIALVFGTFADNAVAQSALKGMNAVVAGMVLATGIKLIPALKNNPVGFRLSLCGVVLTVLCVNVIKMPLAQVLLGLGGLSTLWAARQLRRLQTNSLPPAQDSFENTPSTKAQDKT